MKAKAKSQVSVNCLFKTLSLFCSFLMVFMNIASVKVKADASDPYDTQLVSITVNGQRINVPNSWTSEFSIDLPLSTADDLLNVIGEPLNKKSIITVEGNRLVNNSALIKITVTSENGMRTSKYYVNAQIKDSELSGSFKDIRSAESHSIALKTDGTLYSFGENNFGQLGDGTQINRKAPVQVKNISNVVDFDTSNSHSIAVTSDGSVWVWGLNDLGQLYDRDKSNILTPMRVSGLSGIVKVRAGNRFSLALDKYGSVWFFGYNAKGQFQDEPDESSMGPALVSGLSDVKIKDIAVGDFHCLALTSEGKVFSWGANDFGQLGNNTTDTGYYPAQVLYDDSTSFSGIRYINANGNTSSAVKNDGTAYFWGESSFDDEEAILTPKFIDDILNVMEFDANSNHMVAIKSDGRVYSKGNNEYGQLGRSYSSEYFSEIYNIGRINKLSTAPNNTFLVGADGYVYGCGRNHLGQLGINESGNYYSSLQKLKGFTGSDSVSPVYANYASGEVLEGTKIRLSTDTAYARIYYTLDGSTPTENSTLYKEPITINEYTVIKAIAVSGGRYSTVTTFEYIISSSSRTEMNINIISKPCKMGEYVEIPVTFINVPSVGVASAKFSISFNPQVMYLQSVTYGELIQDSADFSYTSSQDSVTLSFADGSKSSRNITSSGDFAVLKFYVRYNVPSGRYSLAQTYISGEGAFQKNGKAINLYYKNGYVDVNGDTVLYGDVDGDGKLTALDLQYVQRYLADKITYFPASDGSSAADMNKDGQINSNDLELLKKAILGAAIN